LRLLALRLRWLLAFFIVLAGCSQETATLNSDRIRDTFGTYGVEVLRADSRIRLSSLYSGEGDEKTCRTLAIVEFRQPMPSQIAPIHALITAGGSIGEVFRDVGWDIHKTNNRIRGAPPPDVGLDVSALMDADMPATLATHTYDFVVEKNGNRLTYATITEVHHPDYLQTEDLLEIYAETPD